MFLLSVTQRTNLAITPLGNFFFGWLWPRAWWQGGLFPGAFPFSCEEVAVAVEDLLGNLALMFCLMKGLLGGSTRLCGGQEGLICLKGLLRPVGGCRGALWTSGALLGC